jgi:LmbE family N-acetylglucosaminyl deacetylase
MASATPAPGGPAPRRTLVVGLAHPDDELGAAGAILAQRARGDRVVIVWLTRGEMTEAFGPLPSDEVARRRTEQGHAAATILGAEARFLDFPDTRVAATPEAAAEVARVLAELRPDGLLTWGEGWTRGIRHPDHQAAGKIFRDALTLARIAKVVHPMPPHRATVPVFTYRDVHSTLPAVALDVAPYLEKIRELADFYYRGIGFGDPAWFRARLAANGAPWGLGFAEVFDAWESEPGVVEALLPAALPEGLLHPDRRAESSSAAAEDD